MESVDFELFSMVKRMLLKRADLELSIFVEPS